VWDVWSDFGAWTPTGARRAAGAWPGCCAGKELAIDIIAAEIRSAQHEVLLEAAKLVLSGEPTDIARQLRERAERTIRPKK
jgi:hypothetical protein